MGILGLGSRMWVFGVEGFKFRGKEGFKCWRKGLEVSAVLAETYRLIHT